MRGGEEEPPSRFICPITHEVMISPTIASDGYTYERAAITMWLEHHARSPLTNEPLVHLDLYPNHLLRSEIYHRFEGDDALAAACRFYERVREEEDAAGDRVHVAQPVGNAPPLSPTTLAGLGAAGSVAEARPMVPGRACDAGCAVS